MSTEPRTCSNCGKPFQARRSTSMTCSPECARARMGAGVAALRKPDPERYCKHCGKRLVRQRLKTGQLQSIASFKVKQFCGPACLAADRKKQGVPKKCPVCQCDFIAQQCVAETRIYCSRACANIRPRPPREKKTHPCARCEKPIALNRKFCSRACRNLSRPTNKHTGIGPGASAKITKRCALCLAPFETYRSEPKKHCSTKCHRAAQSMRQSGQRSHLWRGGKTDEARRIREHPAYAEWRRKVFERDEHTCQACFGDSPDLTAHHIVAFAAAPRLRLKVSNGVTLCRACHRDLHRCQAKRDVLESTLVSATNKFLEAEPGVWHMKIAGGSGQKTGVPDFLLVVAGRFAALEMKIPPYFASPKQKYMIRLINANGGIARACRSVDDVAALIDAIKGSDLDLDAMTEHSTALVALLEGAAETYT